MDAEIASSITLPATLAEKIWRGGANGAFIISTKKNSSKSSLDRSKTY
jgi:hypothetical protein